MTPARCLVTFPVLLALLAAASASEDSVDLPVATEGTKEWVALVAQAMSLGGRNQEQSLQALSSFQSSTMAKLQKRADGLKKLQKGDFSDVLHDLLTNAVEITAPVFFSSATDLFQSQFAAISFGFTGFQYAPCAIPVTPLGIGIFPQGVNIQPQFFNIAPTGVNIQPQGASISPNLIVIGPYDTTVAGQGLNIAPSLIVVAPTREVVNPVGPLAISDTLVSVEVPALP